MIRWRTRSGMAGSKLTPDWGCRPRQGWIYRFKLGGWMNTPIERTAIPSLTIVLGPFGDVVNFGSEGLYYSWYPTSLIGTSLELKPPDWNATLSTSDRHAILRRSYDELLKRCPRLQSLPYSNESVQPAGGVIFAWGRTDIDVTDSKLHTRHEIGIHSTGKLPFGQYGEIHHDPVPWI